MSREAFRQGQVKERAARACALLALFGGGQGVPSASAEPAAAAPPYPACTEKADDAALQAAQGAFEAGKAAFNEGDFPRAILYWEDAYRRDCSAHLMLRNLARAYEGNEQHQRAVVALSTFLERAAPDAPERAELKAEIRRLETLSASHSGSPAGSPPGPPIDERGDEKETEKRQGTPVGRTPLFESESPSAEQTAPSSAADLAAPLVAVAGAAVAVTSGILWANARADEATAADQCPSRRLCPPEVEAAGNDAIDRQQLWSLIGAGGAVMLTGGVLWYLLMPEEEDSKAELANGSAATHAHVVPRVGGGFVGLEWAQRF